MTKDEFTQVIVQLKKDQEQTLKSWDLTMPEENRTQIAKLSHEVIILSDLGFFTQEMLEMTLWVAFFAGMIEAVIQLKEQKARDEESNQN